MSRQRLAFGIALTCACGALAVTAFGFLARQRVDLALFGAHYELLSPTALCTLALLPLVPWAALGSLADLPRAQRWLSLLVRALLLCLLTLALARPARVEDATRVSAVFLVDVSDSIGDASLEAARAALAEAWHERGDNDLQLVTFAARPHVVPRTSDPAVPPAIARHVADLSEPAPGAKSDLAAALRLADGLFAPRHLARAVLLSDGLQTQGDLLAESARANRFGVSVFYRLFDQERPAEIAASELALPDKLSVGETFELRAHVFSSQTTRARLRLYQDQVLNGLDSIRDLELHPGDNETHFKSVARSAGQITYRLEVQPIGPDHFPDNNSVTTMAVVSGRPRVLIVETDPSHASALAQALSTEDFEVEVRSASALPRSLAELSHYDFVVLSNVAAEHVGSEQLEAITRYVRDLGGGFMMAGGDQSFGLGGYQDTAMEDLLPVTMDSERRRDEHSLALALVIDCSGSMTGQKIELAKDAAKAAAGLLGPSDSLAVIGFSGEPERSVRLQSAKNRLRIEQSIGRLTAQGGTAIFPALDMAFQDLMGASARIKHVILLTDGQSQETGIPELVQAMRAEGITVSTVGLGNDVNRSLLQQAANLGAGRAYFTSDPNNVPRIFVRETTTVGQNSAVEELVRILPAEPADFLKGIELSSAPWLRGYVATHPKRKPAQVLLQSEAGEPLLARWRVGLGWSLAWTSDLEPRWAADLLRWRLFSTFAGQLVREHMRSQKSDELPMHAEVHDDELRVSVDAIGADDRFQNDLDSSVALSGPASTITPPARLERPLEVRAPGRYEARFPLAGYGAFTLHAIHRRGTRVVAQSHAQFSRPYPTEYAVRPPDRLLLQRVAALTGGQALTSTRQLFEPRGQRVAAYTELWNRLVWLALCVLMLDVLLRRVPIFRRGSDP